MTLKNEIFEGLGAATAAQKLVYDPHDDYYQQVADAARRENQRRQKEQDIIDQRRSAAENRTTGASAPTTPGVPTSATSATVPQPTVPGQPPAPPSTQTAMDTSRFPTAGSGHGISPDLSPSAVELPDLRAARGGKIPGRAFQRGGAVEDENPADVLVKQFLAQSGADILLNRQRDFQMRNTTGVRDRDNRAAPLPPTDEQQRIADESGPNSRARQGVLPVAPPSRPTPPSAEDQDRAGYESGLNSRARLGVLPVAPPPPASVEGSPVIPSYQPRPLGGTDTTGVEGSPNIVPPLAAYTPPRLTGTVDQTPEARRSPYPPQATEDDASRIADEGVPNTRARRGNEPPPALDSTEFSAQAGYPEAVTTSRAGRALDALTTPSDRVKALTALNGPEMELRQRRAQVNPGLFEQVTPQEQQRRQAEVDDIDRQLADIDKQREAIQRGQVSPPVGVGAGTAAGTQQAAAAPGTSSPSPQGTTTPPAPPSGAAAANTPSTAPKNEGYQRFQPTERMAMRPDAPDWNALGMDLRAPAGAPSGAPSGRGGGAAAGPPARLGMSDPNRIAAFDPTPGGADMTDPTRRHTELSEALIGAATQARPGPNGELPPVGDKALSRPVGQQLVQAYSQGGRLEPGEAALAGMMAVYRTYLEFGRVGDANAMAYSIMQYANIEASAHAYVAADRVRAGDFGGALRNVAAAAMWLPDGMKHEVGPDGRSITSKDYSGKVTAVTPVDGRWLLAAIEGFKNGDLLWQTLQAAADHLKATDKNAEGRALGHEIQRNTIALQRQRLGKGAAGPKGPAALTEPERQLRALGASVSGVPTPQQLHLPALGGGDEDVDAAQQYPTGYDYNEPSAPP